MTNFVNKCTEKQQVNKLKKTWNWKKDFDKKYLRNAANSRS